MPSLTREDFLTFSALIHKHSGISLSESRTGFLAARILYRMENLNLSSVQDYLYYLKYDPNGGEELQSLLEAVVINETYFLREREHFEALTTTVLPEIISEHRVTGEAPLRLWSAGCSTGEEAYSLAIVVSESIVGQKRWKTDILGTDISNKALASARQGDYREHSLREVSLRQLRRYFEKTSSDTYRVKDKLRDLVHFGQVNLLDQEAVAKVGNFDVIFCRNLLMYMGQSSKRNILMNLYRSLRPGGRLFVGKVETVHGMTDMFEMAHWGSVVYYRKPAMALRESIAS